MHPSLRTLIHGIAITVALHVIAPLAGDMPAPAFLLAYAAPLYFLPFALGLASALNNDRIVMAGLAAILVLIGFPTDLLPYAIATFLGVLIGAGIRAVVIGGNNAPATTTR